MDALDRIYADVILDLFQIEINSAEELDDFYENLGKKLTKDEIELLQVKISEALHRDSDRDETDTDHPSDDTRESESDIPPQLPRITEVKLYASVFEC